MADQREKQLDSIGERIADGIAEGMARLAPKRIKPGSSLYDPKSPFRSKNGPRLKGTVLDNGIALREESLYDREIELCNQITKPGRYINRLVEVLISDDAGTRVVLLRYSDKGVDQRMENKNYWRSLQELLEKIVKEQNAVELVEA